MSEITDVRQAIRDAKREEAEAIRNYDLLCRRVKQLQKLGYTLREAEREARREFQLNGIKF